MKKPKQGEVLLFLVNRSKYSKATIAKKMNIDPSHLSKLFKSELLTSKMITAACSIFGVDESFFDGAVLQNLTQPLAVSEPEAEYQINQYEGLTAAEALRYLEEKDRRHWEERGRLLAIIENLTKK